MIGADRVRQALTDTADLLDSLVDQTLDLMNAGARLDEVIHTVRAPAHLADRPYLRPVYDEPEFVVRNVWRLYGGWWDGNPATLKPAPERGAGRRAGRAGRRRRRVLADRALALLAIAEGDPAPSRPTVRCAWRATWRSCAWRPTHGRGRPPGPPEVFPPGRPRATSTMAKGVFTWAARESVAPPGPHPH